MAVRAVHSYSLLRSASSPPPSALRYRLRHFIAFQSRRSLKLSIPVQISGSERRHLVGCGGLRSCSVHSLVESVMEELEASRKRKRVCAGAKMGLTSSGELLEDELGKQALQKGFLLEFRKDSERVLLAVAQKPDGKKNWMVSDQNGITSSIKPQQITFIVPGLENFDHKEIPEFIKKAQDNLDPTLLEFAWIELLENKKSVTAEGLAEMIFGSKEPLESYCAHILLSKDEVYFTVLENKGSRSVYGPRRTEQVEELLRRKLAKEVADKEFEEFIQLLKSAKARPLDAKPPKSMWKDDEKIRDRIESLQAYAVDACKTDDERKTAGMIDRKDLTHLKVYAIDVDEADELDDALSAAQLQDGRIKVWIHVADPTSLVQPGSMIDREAMRRGTSIFLPTATYPMFPEKLAMEGMSLKQGKLCNAVTVSVVLHPDGCIAEYMIDNSLIRPTYMLTYESASELLHLNLEEEVELKILSKAAALRLKWRCRQGAIDTATIDTRIKVANPDDPSPLINLYVENQADPAMRLVSEMMILCGEVIATYGSSNNIPLPYRGQPQSNIDVSAFAHLPEGPVRSSALVKVMRAAEMDFRKPIRHGILGLPGYVQFTSPIRRYTDLLAHYQVKAFLRGESPPFSAGQLEGISSILTMHARIAKRLCSSSLRYWTLEFLRRQPKEKKFHALVLGFIKDRIASLLLMEVGLQASAWMSLGIQIGAEVKVQVEEAHPRDDVLSLKEVV
ncbi:ribonuclease II, chloroplastic/mitochondrial isoform X2 [Malania oleifera]|uniref:ribonuclease II, chloroplastic/mitochondrial isoform X2 n=1 Tax=Malania oleifera TaxID=397392 RepID=UPI0025AE8C38|nr:ribonuclease II, chloroplastic/mitochondrial isoform X2 [Malania oleifera]